MKKAPTAEIIHNKILKALPPASLARLRPGLKLIELERGAIIDHVDGPIEKMYFVNRGIVSLVKTMNDGRSVEVGAVGIEGITDASALCGIDRAIIETIVQIRGEAFCVERSFLTQCIEADPALAQIMQQYVRFAYGQLAQTAACNRLHTLEERCCRWILTCHDSALQDEFSLTHEFLGVMLGAPRSSVSLVAKVLQRAGCIEYHRGMIKIVDRGGLKDAACECYFSNIAAMKQFIGAISTVNGN